MSLDGIKCIEPVKENIKELRSRPLMVERRSLISKWLQLYKKGLFMKYWISKLQGDDTFNIIQATTKVWEQNGWFE